MDLSYLSATRDSGKVPLLSSFYTRVSFSINYMFSEYSTECITDQFINALK